jgi:hypothetical protein
MRDDKTSKASDAAAAPEIPGAAFYTVCDDRYFVGLVALINSLRLVGHDEPIFVVDAGLAPRQREILAGEARLLRAPEGTAVWFLKPFGALTHRAGVSVLVDSDMIVLRPLTEIIAAAQPKRLVAFGNNPPNHDRFFADWTAALELPLVRRYDYFNAGILFIPASLNPQLIDLWVEAQERLGLQGTRPGYASVSKASLSDPFYFGDQDVLNPLAGAYLSPDQIMLLPHWLAPVPPFTGLRLDDAAALICRYTDGVSPFLLHHITSKPWLSATPRNAYARLLPRLLLRPDLAIRLDPGDVPVRLRDGRVAAAERLRASIQAQAVAGARRQLGKLGIRTRLATLRREITGARN